MTAGAQRLVRLRKERGLTQAQMAKRLGVSQPIVSDYERGGLRLFAEVVSKELLKLLIKRGRWFFESALMKSEELTEPFASPRECRVLDLDPIDQ